MYKYRNRKTHELIVTSNKVTGLNWEPVEEPTQEEPTQEEPTQEEPTQEEPTQEEPIPEESAQEETTPSAPEEKPKARRGKK